MTSTESVTQLSYRNRHKSLNSTLLIERSLNAATIDPPRYCTSLIQWVPNMGFSLHSAPYTSMPTAIENFCQAVGAHETLVDLYLNGFFTIQNPPLLLQLSQSRLLQMRDYGMGAISPTTKDADLVVHNALKFDLKDCLLYLHRFSA